MHEFVDESFQQENTFNNILSIQVSLNGFSFSVVNPENNKLLYFKEETFKLNTESLFIRRINEWQEKEPLLKQQYKEKRIIVVTNRFTLVPDSFYEKNKENEITQVLFKDCDKIDFEEGPIVELNARLIFALPAGLKNIINTNFTDFNIIHPLQQIVTYGNNNCSPNMMCLHFCGKYFTVAIFKNGKLEFANSFEYNHVNDVIYFLLTVLKKLNISSKTITTNYTGFLIPGSGLRSTLKRYFPNHQRLTPAVNVSLPLSDKLISENICLFL